MAKAKAWKAADPDQPSFPNDYEITQKAVLQVTDIKSNHNKYYAIELHTGGKGKNQKFRVFTHYGRTDDLDKNPNSGQKESRYFDSLAEAQASYQTIYKQKTSKSKGYKEVALASSSIGSDKARGTSSGQVDDKTLEKLAEKENAGKKGSKTKKKKAPPKSTLPVGVKELVRYIYEEATTALTTTVNAKITANGIETPLGILTIGQIEKGESTLKELYEIFKKKRVKNRQDRIEQLSSEFYTAIPHRFGRSRAQAAAAIIDSLADFEQKQETLQLMKDMLSVNGDEGNVLFESTADQEYKALGCELEHLKASSKTYKELAGMVVDSQIKTKHIKVKNIYRVVREEEHKQFADQISNQRLLYHGSRIQNWVGLLSRGIMMPKLVVTMGVNRTDAGWLGNGIYFGDAACTSCFYTTPGRKKTRLMAIATVALGKQKEYTKITYGLDAPPAGFDSCHGLRRKKGQSSEFDDDEYVIYNTNQQRMDYLVEFTG